MTCGRLVCAEQRRKRAADHPSKVRLFERRVPFGIWAAVTGAHGKGSSAARDAGQARCWRSHSEHALRPHLGSCRRRGARHRHQIGQAAFRVSP